MALKPCRECGAQVSTSAKTCPHCGVKSPVKKRSVLAWGVFAIVVALIISSKFENTGQGVQYVERTPTDLRPGITRVGHARAAQMWEKMPTTPGIQRWSCNSDLCEIKFNPVLWAQ